LFVFIFVIKVLVFQGSDRNSPDFFGLVRDHVLFEDRFDGYVTNIGDIMIRIVLNIMDILRQDPRIHASRQPFSLGNISHAHCTLHKRSLVECH
jgi:hypothetical protein